MLVLWMIIVVGAIATGVIAATRTEIDGVGNVRARAAARAAAESGILAATLRLSDILAAPTPEQRARTFRNIEEQFANERDVPLAGDVRFGISVVDLNSRVDLNRADDLTLLAFFRQFSGSADAIVAALQDWKDADDRARPGGAEASDYARSGSP
jgi:general secretion pathway protein K